MSRLTDMTRIQVNAPDFWKRRIVMRKVNRAEALKEQQKALAYCVTSTVDHRPSHCARTSEIDSLVDLRTRRLPDVRGRPAIMNELAESLGRAEFSQLRNRTCTCEWFVLHDAT